MQFWQCVYDQNFTENFSSLNFTKNGQVKAKGKVEAIVVHKTDIGLLLTFNPQVYIHIHVYVYIYVYVCIYIRACIHTCNIFVYI